LAIGIPEPLQEFLQFIKIRLFAYEILKPVIELAERGVIVTQNKKTLNSYREERQNKRFQLGSFKVYKENDVIKYPALANTLRRISKNGMEFYKGETAKTLVAYLKEKERLSRQAAKYEAKWRNQLVLNIRI
jgi:gamma-glutamyltranspeptidase/glutathione hydrolase